MKTDEKIIDIAVLAGTWIFLFAFFPPSLILSDSIPAGGDMTSHFYMADYVSKSLLSKGVFFGWCMGNLAGFPVLQNYFPLPFFLTAILSIFIPVTIAFKAVSLLGIFFLPISTYAFFRLCRQKFPVPAAGAVFSLVFLFNESYSMWGGNILSTLAGTFCYAMGLCLIYIYFGLLFRAVTEGKKTRLCIVTLAAAGLCHGYPLVMAGLGSTFFLFSKKRTFSNLGLLATVGAGAGGLMAFWLLPLLANLPLTTPFGLAWNFEGIRDLATSLFPPATWPYAAFFFLAPFAGYIHGHGTRLKPPLFYFFACYTSLSSFLLYLLAPNLKLVDARFLPGVIFPVLVSGAVAFAPFNRNRRLCAVLLLLLLSSTMLLITSREQKVSRWVEWNYSGIEKKGLWPDVKRVSSFLRGSAADPRVAFEHSPLNNQAGTVRIFEALPLFSGRSTLEGLYFQAGVLSPFIYYIQSEISQNPSMPFWQQPYSRPDLPGALDHLKLFNVKDIILCEEATKQMAKKLDAMRHVFSSGPFEIFEIKGSSSRYVQPLFYRPVAVSMTGWKKKAFNWFLGGDLSVHYIFKEGAPPDSPLKKIPLYTKRAYEHLSARMSESVKNNEIIIRNAPERMPVIIKVAYHPNWKAEGAGRIYPVSPGFMLIYPEKPTVRLFYSRSWPEITGWIISAATIFLLFFFHLNQKAAKGATGFFETRLSKPLAVLLLLLASFFFIIILSTPRGPESIFKKATRAYEKNNHDKAIGLFEKLYSTYPDTIYGGRSALYLGICLMKTSRYEKAAKLLEKAFLRHPNSPEAPQLLYHAAVAQKRLDRRRAARLFSMVVQRFNGSYWAVEAGKELKLLK